MVRNRELVESDASDVPKPQPQAVKLLHRNHVLVNVPPVPRDQRIRAYFQAVPAVLALPIVLASTILFYRCLLDLFTKKNRRALNGPETLVIQRILR